MKNAFLAVALVALAGVSCYSTQARKDVVDHADWSYPGMVVDTTKDLFLDLFDIVDLNLGFGDGILVDAQATKVLHAGLGWADAVRVGLRPRAFGLWSQRQAEYGLSIFYWRDINRQAVFGTSTLFDQSMSYVGFDLDHQRETGHWLDIGGNVHALLFGVEAAVSPKEALDFCLTSVKWVFTIVPVRSLLHLCGCDTLGLDLASDDTDSKWMEAGGSPAGAVYQGGTPFFERPHSVTDSPIQPAVKK